MPYSFIYNGNSYGTMDLTVANAGTVRVQFTAAASVPGVNDFQVTGFAFDVVGNLNLSIGNPANNAFPGDENGLNWIKLTNLNFQPGDGSLFLTGTPGTPGIPESVPEPSTLALLGLGLAIAAFAARRKAK